MPVSETTVQSKANDYRSWLLLAAVGIGIILILGIGLVVYAVIRSNQAGQSTAGGLAAINASDPAAAVARLNTQLTEAVKSVPSSDPNSALTAVLNSLLGNTGNATTAHVGVTYVFDGPQGQGNIDFTGDIQQLSATNIQFQGRANIHVETPDIPNLTLPVDLIMANQRLFIKIGTPTGELPEELAMFTLFTDKWLKLDLQSALSTQGATATGTEELLNDSNRTDLLNRWSTNPPLLNPQAAASRTIDGKTLQCVMAEMNPDAFEESDDTPQPVEFCSFNGATPVYIGAKTDTAGNTGEFGLTIYSYGQPVNITEPTEGVVDLEGLFSGLSGL